jgi:hypothetical protein
MVLVVSMPAHFITDAVPFGKREAWRRPLWSLHRYPRPDDGVRTDAVCVMTARVTHGPRHAAWKVGNLYIPVSSNR